MIPKNNRRWMPLACCLALLGAAAVVPGCAALSDEGQSTEEITSKASFFSKDEGMWSFDFVPRARIEQTHPGISLTDAFLGRMRNSTVLLTGNGTGSFVSDSGLVLTNFHVARGFAEQLTTDTFNPMKDGFFASTLADEKTLPDPPVIRVVEDVKDVTKELAPGLDAMSEPERTIAEGTRKAPIVDNCMAGHDPEKTVCEVVEHDGGATYVLYRYKVYKDVRLVAIPPASVGLYASGADPYAFPMWHGDFAFLRIYENGAPLATPEHLTWSTAPLREGESVAMTGFPATSRRGWSQPHYEYVRDKRVGDWSTRYQEAIDALTAALPTATDPVDETAVKSSIADWFNQQLGSKGAQIALSHPGVEAKKKKLEAFVSGAIASQPARYPNYVGFFDGLSEAANRLTPEILARYRTLNGWELSIGGWYAGTLAAMEQQLQLPDAEREDGFHEDQVDAFYRPWFTSPWTTMNKKVEQALIRTWLTRVRREFADEPAVQDIVGAASDEAIAAMTDSVIYDDAKRIELFTKVIATHGQALAGTKDPMLALFQKLRPAKLQALAAFNAADFNVDELGEKSKRAHKAVFGELWPPDANGDLRLAVGTIRRYSAGNPARVATDFPSLFAHAAAHPGDERYALPQLWLDRQGSFSADAQYVVAHALDSSAGNSGSPVVNAEGKVVGVHFGINDPDSDARDDVYTDINQPGMMERGMMMSTQAIEQILAVYGAARIRSELGRP